MQKSQDKRGILAVILGKQAQKAIFDPFCKLCGRGGLKISGFCFCLAGIFSGDRRPVGQFSTLIRKKVTAPHVCGTNLTKRHMNRIKFISSRVRFFHGYKFNGVTVRVYIHIDGRKNRTVL